MGGLGMRAAGCGLSAVRLRSIVPAIVSIAITSPAPFPVAGSIGVSPSLTFVSCEGSNR
jgi:hypothetical protein